MSDKIIRPDAGPSREGRLTWLLTIILAMLIAVIIAMAASKGFASTTALLGASKTHNARR